MIRVVKKKIVSISLDIYNKFIEEKDRETALAMYKKNFSKQMMNAFEKRGKTPVTDNNNTNNKSYLIS